MAEMTHTAQEESAIPGGTRLRLALRWGAEEVPSLLLRPAAPRPAPAALLIHGLTSRKEDLSDTLGAALLQVGVASLAIDLPLHGERGASLQRLSVGNPLELARRWRAAQDECSAALRWLGAQPGVDGGRLALVGYSLGSYLGVLIAAREPSVRAVVLAAGGDLPSDTPFGKLIRAVADPLGAVRRLAGRPLLMVNGRWDRTVRPEQAERLFAAAGEPREIRWYDAGHYLPPGAVADAADWLAGRLAAETERRRSGGSGREGER